MSRICRKTRQICFWTWQFLPTSEMLVKKSLRSTFLGCVVHPPYSPDAALSNYLLLHAKWFFSIELFSYLCRKKNCPDDWIASKQRASSIVDFVYCLTDARMFNFRWKTLWINIFFTFGHKPVSFLYTQKGWNTLKE